MKRILVFGVGVFAAMVSQASYLYWQVDQEDASQFTYTVDGTTKANYATVMRVDGSGNVSYVPSGDEGGNSSPLDINTPPAGSAMSPQGAYLGDIQLAGNYSYYIELSNWNYSNESADWNDRIVLGQSETVSYADLASRGYILENLTSPAAVWTGGTYSVPEPTSGMMILLGLAALALKRR